MLVTSKQYAEHLGVSRYKVAYMCKSGKIPATHKGKLWMIDQDRADLALQRLEQEKVESAIAKARPKKRRPRGDFMRTLVKMLDDCVYGI